MKNSSKTITYKKVSVTNGAYVMGKIPELKGKVNATIDKVKTIRYLCEESIAQLEELKEELTKL
jgi:hypothetical protein